MLLRSSVWTTQRWGKGTKVTVARIPSTTKAIVLVAGMAARQCRVTLTALEPHGGRAPTYRSHEILAYMQLRAFRPCMHAGIPTL